MKKSVVATLSGWLCLALALNTGCQPVLDPLLDIVDARSRTAKIDDYERAISLVMSAKGYANDEFENLTAQNLNRWVARVEQANAAGEDRWVLDPDLVSVIEEHNQVPAIKNIGELVFQRTDAYYLRQADWCDEVVRRVSLPRNHLIFELLYRSAGVEISEQQPEESFLKAIQTLNPSLSNEDAPKMAAVLRLFDWVVRNTQLEPELELTTEEVRDQQLVDISTGKPWFDGVRGVGYVRSPYQSMLYGRADYVERAILLIKLLEHAQLPALMLAIGEKPWVVGVEIGQQLYLFDTRLGLPLPDEKFGKVMTLQRLRSKPDLLRQLDLTLNESLEGDNRYWMNEGDLNQLRALIYVSPEGVSRRMLFLERRMVGDKLQLVQKLDDYRQFASRHGELSARLWEIGFQNLAFRWTLRDALIRSRNDDQIQRKLLWYYDNESYADTFETYRTARNMFVHGLFERDPNTDEFNVIENFYLLMYDDKQIDELATNRPLLMRLGILQTTNQSSREFQERIQGVQGQMRLVRRDAGIFLAQSHFDNGNLGTAGNWLERIALKEDSERWSHQIDYLAARAYEARREFDRSLDELAKSKGPGRHGNLLRMRFLKQVVAGLTNPATQETKPDSLPSEAAKDDGSGTSANGGEGERQGQDRGDAGDGQNDGD